MLPFGKAEENCSTVELECESGRGAYESGRDEHSDSRPWYHHCRRNYSDVLVLFLGVGTLATISVVLSAWTLSKMSFDPAYITTLRLKHNTSRHQRPNG